MKFALIVLPISVAIALVAGYMLGMRGAYPLIAPVENQPLDVSTTREDSSGHYNGPECLDEDQVGPGQPKPYCGDLPSLAALNIREARLEQLPVEFDKPWALEFLSGNEVLVTEFPGTLQRFDADSGKLSEVTGLPEIAGGQGQRGLLDVALHPKFAENRLVYFSYVTSNGDSDYAMAVSRAKLQGDKLSELEQIFLAEPFGSSSSNFGGALMFDSDGYLFIATGDRSERSNAQHPGLLTGKIIRLNDDGSVPIDNPYVADASNAIDPRIYALGVRNPQGLAQDMVTGKIYESEHGPMGGDEVNVIEAGKNYGWPVITYGMNYTYRTIGEGTSKQGMEQPLFYYLPSIAVSPIAVYRGKMFPEWEGDLLVGALKGQAISKLDLVKGRVQSEYEILNELNQRVRDIKVADDGAIWVLLEGGSLYRLSRTEVPSLQAREKGKRDGEQIYLAACAGCHSQNVQGVPQIAVKADWTERLEKGRKQLYRNAIKGFKAMPEKGLCEDCTGDEIRRAVNFMVAKVK